MFILGVKKTTVSFCSRCIGIADLKNVADDRYFRYRCCHWIGKSRRAFLLPIWTEVYWSEMIIQLYISQSSLEPSSSLYRKKILKLTRMKNNKVKLISVNWKGFKKKHYFIMKCLFQFHMFLFALLNNNNSMTFV